MLLLVEENDANESGNGNRFSKSFAAGAVAFECNVTRVTYVTGLLLPINIFAKVTFPYIHV